MNDLSMRKIRVLVIDDSAFARKVIRELLERDPDIQVVGIARDGLEGLEKIAELKPDVITLDLMMPDLDGIGVLGALPNEGAPRAIIVSVSGSDTEIALRALEMGAIDIVNKPTPLPTDRLYDMSRELVEKVKGAARAQVRSKPPSTKQANALPFRRAGVAGKCRLVVIGTSTGGPQALSDLFRTLPAGLPVSIAVALHIPHGYTMALAARLSRLGEVPMVEAYDGMEIPEGTAAIAPGGMHLAVEESAGKIIARVGYEPAETLHHPSVDVLFESASKLGHRALGVILTGMGSDGLLGSTRMKETGGRIVAESASSCVVYGMPRSVIEAGVASGEAPIERMSTLISEAIFGLERE